MPQDATTEGCPDAYVALAERLASVSREVIRQYFRTPVAVEQKPDDSPVTVADREAEAAMRRLISSAAQDHGVFGEEYGAERTDAEYVWVLDPIDGTKRFITGHATFGPLIALLRHGVPVLGVINMPMMGERWLGVAGRPTTHCDHNGTREVRVRACAEPGQAVLCATTPDMFAGAAAAGFDRLRRAVKDPLYGGDCFSYGTLASGRLDLVVEAEMAIYDFMALVPVVEGAGGRITDWQGRPLDMRRPSEVVAVGDPALHEAVIDVLAG